MLCRLYSGMCGNSSFLERLPCVRQQDHRPYRQGEVPAHLAVQYACFIDCTPTERGDTHLSSFTVNIDEQNDGSVRFDATLFSWLFILDTTDGPAKSSKHRSSRRTPNLGKEVEWTGKKIVDSVKQETENAGTDRMTWKEYEILFLKKKKEK